MGLGVRKVEMGLGADIDVIRQQVSCDFPILFTVLYFFQFCG